MRTQVTCQKIKSQTRQQITSPRSLTTSHRPDRPWSPQPSRPAGKEMNQNRRAASAGLESLPPARAKPGRAERWPHHGAGKQNGAGRRRGCAWPPSLPRSRAALVPARRPGTSHPCAGQETVVYEAMGSCPPPASMCVQVSVALSPFLCCPQALGCCSSFRPSVRSRAASRADDGLPPHPSHCQRCRGNLRNVRVPPPLFVCGFVLCGFFK